MKYNNLNLSFLSIIFISFLFISCSDELVLEDSNSSDLSVKEGTSTEEITSNDISTQKNEDMDTMDQLEYQSLDEMVEVLAVSDDIKTRLKNFMENIKQELNLDDCSILSALSKGNLEELGINNEDVRTLLYTIFLGSSPELAGIMIFLDILEELDLDLGSGNLNPDKLSSLLFSDNLKTFVEENIFNGDGGAIFNKIKEFASKMPGCFNN